MQKLKGEEVLLSLIDVLISSLDELYSLKDYKRNHFIEGEKTAYVECLEMIQRWESAEERGLNYNIETRYPLS